MSTDTGNSIFDGSQPEKVETLLSADVHRLLKLGRDSAYLVEGGALLSFNLKKFGIYQVLCCVISTSKERYACFFLIRDGQVRGLREEDVNILWYSAKEALKVIFPWDVPTQVRWKQGNETRRKQF